MAIDRTAYVTWATELGLSVEEAERDVVRVEARGAFLNAEVLRIEGKLIEAKAKRAEHNRLTNKPEGWMVIARRFANSEISEQPIG